MKVCRKVRFAGRVNGEVISTPSKNQQYLQLSHVEQREHLKGRSQRDTDICLHLKTVDVFGRNLLSELK
jgi:hypothetical protein